MLLIAAYIFGGPRRNEQRQLARLHRAELEWVDRRHEWEKRQSGGQGRVSRLTALGTMAGVLGLFAGVTGYRLASSSGEGSDTRTAREQAPATTSPAPRASTTTSELSAPPATTEGAPLRPMRLAVRPSDSPAALADEIVLAEQTVRDAASDELSTEAASRYLQLAYRKVATNPVLRVPVFEAVQPSLRRTVEQNVQATESLLAGLQPQSVFPEWVISDPEPAERLQAYYQEAQTLYGVEWTYLAAIHLIKTRMGRINVAASARAQGPMQFLPSTWERYGSGGDIRSNRDSILAAARLLAANSSGNDVSAGLRVYDRSDGFVLAATLFADVMRSSPRSYLAYYSWQVIYSHKDGLFVLPVGYPQVPPKPVP